MVVGPGILVAVATSWPEWPGSGCPLGVCPVPTTAGVPPGLPFLILGLVMWCAMAAVRHTRRND